MDYLLYDKSGIVIPTLAMMKNMSIHMGKADSLSVDDIWSRFTGATQSVISQIVPTMKEYFFFSKDVKNFLFEDLNFHGAAGVVGVCLVCFAFTVLLEGTKSLLYYLNLRLNQNPLTYGRTDTSINQDRVKFHLSGYLLHTIDLFLGYILMLAIMSYDAYIFISVIVGSGVGYFIFGAVNVSNRAKFNALKLSVYDRYDSQAGLTVSGSVTNSELSIPSPR